MGQVALVPEASSRSNVVQPFVEQNSRLGLVVRRMRRRAEVC